jgi:DNA processing protein
MIEDSVLRLSIARLTFLKCREQLMVAEVVQSREFFASLKLWDLEQIVGRTIRSSSFDPARILLDAESDSVLLTAVGAEPITVADPKYPPQLREIYDPPFVLFVRGTIPSLEQPLVAIVGTRKPSRAGTDAAHALASECSRAGVPVVSGLALGIDSAAHAGALAAGGITVAVLGSGIDCIYPRSHRSLAARILDTGGAIISEYPPRAEPRKYYFPARNRIISGLCRAVVVVEAPERSGALITADYALDQGRDLYVHAVSKSSAQGGGSRRLIIDGAPVIRTVNDIHEDWTIAEDSDGPASGGTESQPEPVRPGLHLARSLQMELDL